MEIKEGNQTTILPDSTPRMSHAEWLAEGERRFGKDFESWKFVCPICKNVASIGDFKQFKEKGATPNSATVNCIGRFDGSKFRAFSGDKKERGQPCDYALYGLFRFPGVVITSQDGQREHMAFAFAEAGQ